MSRSASGGLRDPDVPESAAIGLRQMEGDLMKRFLVVSFGLVVALGLLTQPTFAELLVDRGLPGDNLNNPAGADRSNVTWASDSATGFTGDDFTIGTIGEKYRIDSLTVWGVQIGSPSNILLYLGKAGDSLALAPGGSSLNITASVSYPGGTGFYEGSSGTHYDLAQATFSGLNFLVDGGVTYNFGAQGVNGTWYSHASNAALSGTFQEGADGKFLEFDAANLGAAPIVWDSSTVIWNKPSDINVQVDGEMVPEPTTLVIWSVLGTLGIALGWWRKRRVAA
ncbi:MAG: hypothetical protein ACYC35_25675 [Pirellulales bacterium]